MVFAVFRCASCCFTLPRRPLPSPARFTRPGRRQRQRERGPLPVGAGGSSRLGSGACGCVMEQDRQFVDEMIPELTPWPTYGQNCPVCVGKKSSMGECGIYRWNVDDPDKLVCKYCGTVYPEPQVPGDGQAGLSEDGADLHLLRNRGRTRPSGGQVGQARLPLGELARAHELERRDPDLQGRLRRSDKASAAGQAVRRDRRGRSTPSGRRGSWIASPASTPATSSTPTTAPTPTARRPRRPRSWAETPAAASFPRR